MSERTARLILFCLLAVAIAAPALTIALAPAGLLVRAQMPENGGWQPGALNAKAGEPLHLRLTSDDVLHSFAIGQSDLPPVDVVPGEITEVTLTFDQPGKYTFYCTRWCGVNHWRMRGTIDVAGAGSAQTPDEPPLYHSLKVDIDADVYAETLPELTPSAARGAEFRAALSGEALTRQDYLTRTPEEIWRALRGSATLSHLSDQEVWDLTAWFWKGNITRQELQTGAELYAANCAACHGEQGAGDGVFANAYQDAASGDHTDMAAGEMTRQPTDFTDSRRMLAISSARLQGKILRGGMGTGMPYWGPIFTTQQTWALTAYLWTFLFDLEDSNGT